MEGKIRDDYYFKPDFLAKIDSLAPLSVARVNTIITFLSADKLNGFG